MTQAALICSFVRVQTMADGTPRLTLDLPGVSLLALAGMDLMPGAPLALARLTDAAAQQHQQTETIKAAEPTGYGDYYTKLYRSGFFRGLPVLQALGTDAQYLAWVKRKPSCVSGEFSEYHDNGDRFSIPAHVRRVANGAGTGIKPPFSAVPLTNDEHQIQHGKDGENAFGGKEFFDKQRGKYVTLWAKERFYDLLGVTSLADVEPARFEALCNELGIYKYLPRG